MDSIKIIKKLIANGYPMMLIASQSGVPYRLIYNRYRGFTETEMDEKNLKKLERFAYRQPCFDGVEVDSL